jgi:hypothetical protein
LITKRFFLKSPIEIIANGQAGAMWGRLVFLTSVNDILGQSQEKRRKRDNGVIFSIFTTKTDCKRKKYNNTAFGA